MDQVAVLIAWIIGILLIVILGRFFFIPLKLLIKLTANGIIGGICIFIINFLGKYIGLHIGLNIFSALIVGILGVPGVILLLILKSIL